MIVMPAGRKGKIQMRHWSCGIGGRGDLRLGVLGNRGGGGDFGRANATENRMSAGFNDSAARQPHFPRWDELLEEPWEYARLETRAESWRLREAEKACLTCSLADCKEGARACPLNASGHLAAERQRSYNRKSKARERARMGTEEMVRKQREWKADWRERQREKSA